MLIRKWRIASGNVNPFLISLLTYSVLNWHLIQAQTTCSRNGTWGAWQSWSDCSASSQMRYRDCDPLPAGCLASSPFVCTGNYTDTQSCSPIGSSTGSTSSAPTSTSTSSSTSTSTSTSSSTSTTTTRPTSISVPALTSTPLPVSSSTPFVSSSPLLFSNSTALASSSPLPVSSSTPPLATSTPLATTISTSTQTSSTSTPASTQTSSTSTPASTTTVSTSSCYCNNNAYTCSSGYCYSAKWCFIGVDATTGRLDQFCGNDNMTRPVNCTRNWNQWSEVCSCTGSYCNSYSYLRLSLDTTTTSTTPTTPITTVLQTDCPKVPSSALTLSPSVQANSIFTNGSCFISAYVGNVSYSNITSYCTNVMRSTRSLASCQMLQTTNTAPINSLISNKIIQTTDRFLIGLSRDGCNGLWKWANADGSITYIDTNLTQYRGLPSQNSSCGFDNVMYTTLSNYNYSSLTGSPANSTGNVLVCECRTDFGVSTTTAMTSTTTPSTTTPSTTTFSTSTTRPPVLFSSTPLSPPPFTGPFSTPVPTTLAPTTVMTTLAPTTVTSTLAATTILTTTFAPSTVTTTTSTTTSTQSSTTTSRPTSVLSTIISTLMSTTTARAATLPPTNNLPVTTCWTTWGAWSTCSASCGMCGAQQRFRNCQATTNCTCTDAAFEKVNCGSPVCLYPATSSCCTGFRASSVNSVFTCVNSTTG